MGRGAAAQDEGPCDNPTDLAHGAGKDTEVVVQTHMVLSGVREIHVMAPADTDGNLLFGLLALQNGLIDQGALFAAFAAWTRDKRRPLADHLVELGHLDAPRRAAVEAIACVHVQALGGDAGKSLTVLTVGPSIRETLSRAGGPEVEATLGYVGSAPGSTRDEDGLDRTGTYAVGPATSGGQRFRILRPHARGGLGVVFVALDSELDREVALKQILDNRADDPTSRYRFLIEAQITGGLEHPGIVPVYGLGTDGDGRPYYAMRFIRGNWVSTARLWSSTGDWPSRPAATCREPGSPSSYSCRHLPAEVPRRCPAPRWALRRT